MINKYFRLTKPGIIFGNLITAIAGFNFASAGDFRLSLFLALVFGLSAIIASACVFNNYIDREIDAKMARTKKRSLAAGDIKVVNALVFAAVLGILGSLAIILFINTTTLVLGLIAYINYIVFYGIVKRRSIHGTLVGSISGATPPAAGYTAVTGRFDEIAALLFLILVFWQMPHFYSIAIFRLKDYKAANIPVLSIVKGIYATKISIIVYILLFSVAVLYFFFAANAGYLYLAAMSAGIVFWLSYGFKGFKTKQNKAWAGKMFTLSLRVLLTFSVMISLDNYLI